LLKSPQPAGKIAAVRDWSAKSFTDQIAAANSEKEDWSSSFTSSTLICHLIYSIPVLFTDKLSLDKGAFFLTRPHSAWIIIIALLALLRTWAAAPQASADDFKHPPYPLQMVGGGNCVWLAWELAWLRWGFILPVVGHARQWTSLDGIQLQQGGRVGTLAVVDQPVPDSIMIIPPSEQLQQSQIIGGYGHLAWVAEVHPQYIVVIESSIFPQQPGQQWQGCWYRQSEYDFWSLNNARFLYLAEVQPAENDTTGSADFAHLALSSNGITSIRSNDHIWQSCRDMWSYTLLTLKLLFRQ
jgi:surface antigen